MKNNKNKRHTISLRSSLHKGATSPLRNPRRVRVSHYPFPLSIDHEDQDWVLHYQILKEEGNTNFPRRFTQVECSRETPCRLGAKLKEYQTRIMNQGRIECLRDEVLLCFWGHSLKSLLSLKLGRILAKRSSRLSGRDILEAQNGVFRVWEQQPWEEEVKGYL